MKMIFCALTLGFVGFVQAKTVLLENSIAEVSFLTTANPGGIRIRGNADNRLEKKSLKGKYDMEKDSVSGQMELTLKDLDTGIGLRNQHMTEKYLETDKYPTATLELSKTVFEENKETPFKGILSLHGQKKPIEGKLTAKSNSLNLDFTVKLSDYNIEIPKFMGITMKEDIHVQAESTETL